MDGGQVLALEIGCVFSIDRILVAPLPDQLVYHATARYLSLNYAKLRALMSRLYV